MSRKFKHADWDKARCSALNWMINSNPFGRNYLQMRICNRIMELRANRKRLPRKNLVR